MNISKGKLILLVAAPLALALVWGIITTNRLSAARTTLQQTQITLSQTQNELTDANRQLNDVTT